MRVEQQKSGDHNEDSEICDADGMDSYRWDILLMWERKYQSLERECPSSLYSLQLILILNVVIRSDILFVTPEGETATSNALEMMKRKRTKATQIKVKAYTDCLEMHADLTRGRSEDVY